MYLIYTALLTFGLLVTLPYWLVQMARHGKYRAGLKEKLGVVPEYLRRPDPRRVIWVHAVSLGEVLAVSPLITKLHETFPEHRILVSTTTNTGQKMARERFGAENVFYFPLDLPSVMRRYLRVLTPELVVLAETEFWPNFLRLAHAGGTKIAVVNGRISDRSFPGYRRWRWWLSRILQNIDVFLAQTQEDRRRLVEIGAATDKVSVSGNLKFDVAVPAEPPIVARLRAALAQAGEDSVIVAGSTVEGEEEVLLRTFQKVLEGYPSAVMILAPRHPERFDVVAGLLEELEMRQWRRSLWKDEAIGGGVFLLDSIGELAGIYSLARIAFVGGSLVPRGGHNIIEPARNGAPILVGPYTENFRDIVGLFERNRAVRIVNAAGLPAVVLDLLGNHAAREELGRKAREIWQAQRGATDRTIEALRRLLKGVQQESS